MNFVSTFKAGKKGDNKGLPTGIRGLDKAINGLQRKSIIGLAAPSKAGKTTLVDYAFLINPYLYSLQHPEVDIEWIYFSYEIDRVTKEFDVAAFFFFHDYQIEDFTYKGREYKICSSYFLGLLTDHEDKLIQVSPEHEQILKEIYLNRIIPLFGEWNELGEQIKPGKVIFIEARDNPTGMQKFLYEYAEKNGTFITKDYKDAEGKMQKRKIGYKAKNPNKFTIIITDHLRKLLRERGFSMKENVDKWIEYSVVFRNMCHFTFIHIIHLNRNLSDIERLKFDPEHLYPTSDDVKDTGNLGEEANYMLTLFKPTDEKYNIQKHFGLELHNYPNYRSIHLVESRNSECPVHIQVEMLAWIKTFKPI